MPNLLDMLAGRRTDFSSAKFEAELDRTVATGSASAIGKLCDDVFYWCQPDLRRVALAQRLTAPDPLQRVVRDGDAKDIGRVATLACLAERRERERIAIALADDAPLSRLVDGGSARALSCVAHLAKYLAMEQRSRVAEALTADAPLARVIKYGDANAIGELLDVSQFHRAADQRTHIVDALTSGASLAKLVRHGNGLSIGYATTFVDAYGSPENRQRIMDALTVPPLLKRVVVSNDHRAIGAVAYYASLDASPDQLTRIVDTLTASGPLATVCDKGTAMSITRLLAVCAYATADQRTRIVDALTADAPLARVAHEADLAKLGIVRSVASRYGSPEHYARVTRALDNAVLLNAVTGVHIAAAAPLTGEERATWSAGAAGATEPSDISNLATLIQRTSQENVELRGGALTVATRMLPTLQALGARQELIGQAAGYANARGLCVNLPEAVWSELAAAVPLLDALAATPLNPHECVRSAGVLSARQNVDRVAAQAGASLRLDGETPLVGPSVEIEYGGLVLAGVNELLPAVQRLPGVARQGEVAYIGTLEGEPMDRLPGVAAEAAAAAITAMEPANAARYLLDSTYAPVWQARLQGAFPEQYVQVTARADAMLETAENPQIVPAVAQGDTMQALGQWRDVRHDEITRQLTPGLQTDHPADTLHEVRLRLADVWRREPVGLDARVAAASAGLQAVLDATPGPQAQAANATAASQSAIPATAGASAGAVPSTPLHWSAIPNIAPSLPMAPVMAGRRAPRGHSL